MLAQIQFDKSYPQKATLCLDTPDNKFTNCNIITLVAALKVPHQDRNKGEAIHFKTHYDNQDHVIFHTKDNWWLACELNEVIKLGVMPTIHYNARLITSNLGNGNIQIYSKLNTGTCLSAGINDQLVQLIEGYRGSKTRLRFWYGDRFEGFAWGDIEEGTIGRSNGEVKIPLLIRKSNSSGGGSLMENSIIRVDQTSSALSTYFWQHRDFHLPPNCPWCNQEFGTYAPRLEMVRRRLPKGQTHQTFCGWCRREKKDASK